MATTPAGKGQSLVVTLKVPSTTLEKLGDASPNEAKANGDADMDGASDSNATPGPNGTPNGSMAPPAVNSLKRKGVPGPKPGHKRQPPAIDVNAPPKPRGKPGPKKRKLDDGTAAPSHKLGPKANQGAINAGLRALDRTGKPCRRWQKAPLQLKSFTGVQWKLGGCWQGLVKAIDAADASKSDGSSDVKQENHSSAVGSDNGNSGADSASNAPAPGTVAGAGIGSSPMPESAGPAEVTA